MSGRQVLITGASRGLGLELVKQYATGGGSAIVFAACRQGAEAPALKALLRELQRELASDTAVVPVRLDVTCPASVAALSATLSQHDASLNVLWNNAGIAVGRECQVSNGTMDYDAWESCLATNVMGPTRVLETCLPHLDSKAFTVVNVSSGLGSISRVMGGGFDTLSQDVVYRSSKAALNMCTVCSAAELKAKFPASNAVVVAMASVFAPRRPYDAAPGWVNTDMGSRGGTVAPPLEPETSVKGMLEVVAKLTAEDTGKFFNYRGEEVPW